MLCHFIGLRIGVWAPSGLPVHVQKKHIFDLAVKLTEKHSLSRVVNIDFSWISDYTESVKNVDVFEMWHQT